MDEIVRERLWLWLRSEQAMGLRMLPISLPEPRASAPEPASAAAPLGPAVASVPRSRPATSPRQAPPVQNPVPAAPPVPEAISDAAIFGSGEQASFETPVLPREQKIKVLAELDRSEVTGCTKCRLCKQRTHTVFGEGDVEASIFFIGEGPGETEDQTGRPFVGRAGQKLDEMIAAMGLRREQVYIANIVKCRPPGNRAPAPDEVETCTPYLLRQIEVVRPKVIVTLGLPATRFLLQTNLSMGRMRGQWHTWRGIKVMPTYHPSYVLRNYTPETRRAVWSDLQQVMVELGLKPPKRG